MKTTAEIPADCRTMQIVILGRVDADPAHESFTDFCTELRDYLNSEDTIENLHRLKYLIEEQPHYDRLTSWLSGIVDNSNNRAHWQHAAFMLSTLQEMHKAPASRRMLLASLRNTLRSISPP